LEVLPVEALLLGFFKSSLGEIIPSST